MDKYNPDIHHRRSIRSKEYDYSRAGLYFVTICTQHRECLFGRIDNGEMILNDAGKFAEKCWTEIPDHFPNIQLHEHIIMPDHIHGIIEIVSTATPVGANNYSPENHRHSPENHRHSPENHRHSPENHRHSPENHRHSPEKRPYPPGQLSGCVNRAKDFSPLRWVSPSKTIGSVVRGFKIGVTKWMRQNTKIYHVWQRNYHDHIIRNPKEYDRISNYINNNPAQWKKGYAKKRFAHYGRLLYLCADVKKNRK